MCFKKKQAFISILSWKKEKHICVHMILMLLWNTNNKMAAPAPVQLQRPVTVSDLVCCVFVYGYSLYIRFTVRQSRKVMFSVMSVCSWGIPMWPLPTMPLASQESHGDHLPFRPVQTCSLCSPYIYRQAGGWPSTERPSCIGSFNIFGFLYVVCQVVRFLSCILFLPW